MYIEGHYLTLLAEANAAVRVAPKPATKAIEEINRRKLLPDGIEVDPVDNPVYRCLMYHEPITDVASVIKAMAKARYAWRFYEGHSK